jgi:hypothetical protein
MLQTINKYYSYLSTKNNCAIKWNIYLKQINKLCLVAVRWDQTTFTLTSVHSFPIEEQPLSFHGKQILEMSALQFLRGGWVDSHICPESSELNITPALQILGRWAAACPGLQRALMSCSPFTNMTRRDGPRSAGFQHVEHRRWRAGLWGSPSGMSVKNTCVQDKHLSPFIICKVRVILFDGTQIRVKWNDACEAWGT